MQELLALLKTNTFTGNASIFSNWGRILKTFKIPDPSMNILLFAIPTFFSGIIAAINIASY